MVESIEILKKKKTKENVRGARDVTRLEPPCCCVATLGFVSFRGPELASGSCRGLA